MDIWSNAFNKIDFFLITLSYLSLALERMIALHFLSLSPRQRKQMQRQLQRQIRPQFLPHFRDLVRNIRRSAFWLRGRPEKEAEARRRWRSWPSRIPSCPSRSRSRSSTPKTASWRFGRGISGSGPRRRRCSRCRKDDGFWLQNEEEEEELI